MAYYSHLWNEAQDNLRQNIAYDQQIKKKCPVRDLNRAKWMIGHLFMNYVRIINTLDECYDQIVHPQKREVIGRLLDTSLGRLLEVKKDLVKIELDDYIFFDNVLIELGLTPQDVEIKVPQYFWRDREKSKAYRRNLIKEIYEQLKEEEYMNKYFKNISEEERKKVREVYLRKKRDEKLEEELHKKRLDMEGESGLKKKPEKELSDSQDIVDAILLIQRHERARQNRRALGIQKRRLQWLRGEREVKIDDVMANKAARIIQQHWRRHRKRVVAHTKLQKEMLLMGMLVPSWKDLSGLEKIQKLLKHRKMMQERNQEEYENALAKIKEKIMKMYSVSMYEDTTDEIRHWFEWFFLQSDFLPDFPSPDLVIPTGDIFGIPKKISKEFIKKNFSSKKKNVQHLLPDSKLWLKLAGIEPIGGSALIVADYWIGPKEFLLCQNELERLKKSGTSEGEKPKKLTKEEKAALKKKEKEAERRMLEAEETEGFGLRESNFLVPLIKADKDYRDFWLDLDETDNYDQRYIYDLVKNDKCYEMSMEVRKAVDETMRLELDVLKDALERDRGTKKKKKKMIKEEKKKIKKENRDPTGDRTVDDLFKELFRNGIIKEYKEAYLKDFIGEKSFTAFEHRSKLEDGLPSLGDVRDLILQMCILPLGSMRIHQLSPVVRSTCLIGLEDSGKEFLARIVCTETASVMFDLTPENIAGKYPGKDGLKMLTHLVEKMSRILQPSVIFIKGAEKLFYKKVPKEEKIYEPKRLGGTLAKIVKNIKSQDQILVLGTSSFPWLCPKRKLTQTYDKFIFIPEIDYGTRFILWQKLLLPYHSIPREFDFSCLAKISKGYSVKTIQDLVKQIMTPERICKGRERPFTPEEFMEDLCKIEKTPEKIVKKYMVFYNTSDLRRIRLKRLQETKEAQEKVKKKE